MLYIYGHNNDNQYNYGVENLDGIYKYAKPIIYEIFQYYSAVSTGEGVVGNPVSFWTTTNKTTMYGYRAVRRSRFAGTIATGYYCFPLVSGATTYSYSLYGKISSYDNESGTHIYGDATYSGTFGNTGLTTTLFGGSGSSGSTHWASTCVAYISDTLTFDYESNVDLGEDMQIFKFYQILAADDDVGWSEIDIQDFTVDILN